MAASYNKYNSFSEYMADGTFDLNTDTFKVALVASTYTPSAAHTVWTASGILSKWHLRNKK